MKQPDVAARLVDMTMVGTGSTPAELASFMQQERERDPTAGIAPLYWYPIGRDHELERQLASRIRMHVDHPEDLKDIVPIG